VEKGGDAAPQTKILPTPLPVRRSTTSPHPTPLGAFSASILPPVQ